MTFIDALCRALRAAAAYNAVDQAPPAAVLWPDRERQWEALLPRLQAELPVLRLGPFDAPTLTGPAIWLRCMVERTLPEAAWGGQEIPILYLPGVSRQELAAVEDAPPLLQPLAELQYRGVLWTQKNGRDWTPDAFIQSAEPGLGLEVAADAATHEALLRALPQLADEPVEELRKDAPLTASRFNSLLNPDQVRNLLLWMDNPAQQRSVLTDGQWSAFCAECQRVYGFSPEIDGEITAATLLGARQHAWSTVWNRFAEAPFRYPHLPELLRKARPAQPDGLFHIPASWPQENEAGESALRARLLSLEGKTVAEAQSELGNLERTHGERREWVWSELGFSPLANGLPALTALSQATQNTLGGASPEDIARAYTDTGWQVDALVLKALAEVETVEDVSAVKAVIRTLYEPWLRAGAEAFQQAVVNCPAVFPSPPETAAAPEAGTCLVFADGLRYDVARMLTETLERKGFSTKVEWRFGVLPGVTATAKPGSTPVAALLGPGSEFQSAVRADGATVRAEILRRELTAAGYPALSGDQTGNPSGAAWTESGSIDSYGHAQGWKLARRVREEVGELTERIGALLQAGWQQVKVVTDHGWLLLPGGLPDVSLPLHLTDARKGRCARLKPSTSFPGQTVPWFWDDEVRIAVAPGIHCYIAGKEYEHGGLSPQECVLPVVTVSAGGAARTAVTVEEVKWTGMRCRIQVTGAAPGLTADLRTKAADGGTSLLAEPKSLRDGQASVVVPDDSQEGNAAFVVILGADGGLLAQRLTTVGG